VTHVSHDTCTVILDRVVGCSLCIYMSYTTADCLLFFGSDEVVYRLVKDGEKSTPFKKRAASRTQPKMSTETGKKCQTISSDSAI